MCFLFVLNAHTPPDMRRPSEMCFNGCSWPPVPPTAHCFPFEFFPYFVFFFGKVAFACHEGALDLLAVLLSLRRPRNIWPGTRALEKTGYTAKNSDWVGLNAVSQATRPSLKKFLSVQSWEMWVKNMKWADVRGEGGVTESGVNYPVFILLCFLPLLIFAASILPASCFLCCTPCILRPASCVLALSLADPLRLRPPRSHFPAKLKNTRDKMLDMPRNALQIYCQSFLPFAVVCCCDSPAGHWRTENWNWKHRAENETRGRSF